MHMRPLPVRLHPHRLLGSLGLLLAGCAEVDVERIDLDEGAYWQVRPRGLPKTDVPGLVHLHHSGDGEALARTPRIQAELIAAGMVGLFPMGGGEPGDDWRVGRNKDNIPRDDRAFLADVARDAAAREALDHLWLSGFSKGGAMTYDYACLGEEDLYAGFLPMSGAFQDWVPEECTHPATPIRHLQGSEDDKWPRTTAEDPDSSHEGILDSLAGLAATDADCLSGDPQREADELSTCEVWSDCPVDVRLCVFEGGHNEPAGWILAHRDWMALIRGE